MLIFCRKNVHFLKNTVLSCHFFNFYMKNPLLSCLYLIKKPSILSKLLILWIKEVNRMLFFFLPIFYGKITSLMPIFCQENVHCQKIQCSQVHILSKNVQSLKNTVLWCQFLKFFTKTPCCQAHIWLKKRQFCQNYTILWTS